MSGPVALNWFEVLRKPSNEVAAQRGLTRNTSCRRLRSRNRTPVLLGFSAWLYPRLRLEGRWRGRGRMRPTGGGAGSLDLR